MNQISQNPIKQFGWRLILLLVVLVGMFGTALVLKLSQPASETPEQVAHSVEALGVIGSPQSMQELQPADVASLAALDFYAEAKAGDWVVRYQTVVVLYRPSEKAIIHRWEVGSIPDTVVPSTP
jgi:hypothetical protein